MPGEKEMSFLDHLEEFRERLIKCLVSVVIFSVVAFFFSAKMIDFIAKPLPGVYFMGPVEALSVRMKIAMIVGAIVSSPVILYQLWQFIVPGLLEKEVKVVAPLVFFSTFSFIVGASFAFFIVLPNMIKFLLSFGTDKLHPWIKIDDYLSFIGYTTLIFGVVFELPVVSYFLGKIGIISSATLRKGRRYAVVAIMIVAAFVTPTPDAFNMMLLAVPLYVLYEISIIVLLIQEARKKKKLKGEIQ
ncbi:MAG: twin arginine-targeting protein translocase TatC [candidate division Zixibacteria bacterium RBG_16_43_9]|nr:MAG: twin arginine-targeting protein translocase TatC [candidate division Zixibacteria bacterium RBG_16_43_9]